MGSYIREKNEITLNETLKDVPEDVLLHEIQHTIQDIENFASGNTPENVGRALFAEMYQTVKNTPEYMQLSTPEERSQYVADYLRKAKPGTNTVFRRYSDTAGEVEARDSQSRMRMSEAERRQIVPDISGVPQYGRSSSPEFLDILREMGYSEDEVQRVKREIENGQSGNGENHRLFQASESREGRTFGTRDEGGGRADSRNTPDVQVPQRYTGRVAGRSSSGRNTVTDSGRASLRTSGGVNLDGARTLDEYVTRKYGPQPAAQATPAAAAPASDAATAAVTPTTSEETAQALERTAKSRSIQSWQESQFVRELGDLFGIPEGESRARLRFDEAVNELTAFPQHTRKKAALCPCVSFPAGCAGRSAEETP